MPAKRKTAFATFDGANAAAFLYERAEKRLTPLAGFPMSGEKKPEFSSEKGRVFNSADDRRSAAEPLSDHEKIIEREFVEAVADRLGKLLDGNAFDKLIVAAGPRALGYWRDVAPKKLAAAVDKELNGNYANMDPQALLGVVEDAFLG